MAKKKKPPADRRQAASESVADPAAHPAARASAATASVPAEVAGSEVTALVLALMMFLAPALGVPHEEMLQDTLKSMVVSLSALGAALMFFWSQRQRSQPLRWHAVMWLPLLLMVYALGSMAWSHTYLGGVEAIRWFVFSLLLWLGLNTFSRDMLPRLAWGVHAGVVVASLWTALQFWFDFRFFPQGPNPGSTFVNRNFFAEFAACTLPFSALLLARARTSVQIGMLSSSSAFVLVAILMTGTRSALVALWLQLLIVLPLIGWRYRSRFAFPRWSSRQQLLALGLLLFTVLALGLLKSGNAKIIGEGRGLNALERGLSRTASITPGDESLGLRMIMWKATAGLIQQRPLSGVGAGAWESDIPLYQAAGSQLETDYYVHNEFLQLLAEYGLVGWAFLGLLFAYLLWAAARTWRDRSAEGELEAPYRALLLCALLALFIVSNAGFPWRMAATGALFALCLGALAASDARLTRAGSALPAMPLRWRPAVSLAGMGASLGCLALAIHISHQAAQSEQKIIRATRLALMISASGSPNQARWNGARTEVLRLIREGIAINPHYRKVTPMVADELARWGDWKNAISVWESVLSSRPYIVAIMANVARGYAVLGEPDKALASVERARKVQPTAPALQALEVLLRARLGQDAQALAVAREAIDSGNADVDLLNAAFMLASRTGDYELARKAMELRLRDSPAHRADGYLQLGKLHASAGKDRTQALLAFEQALAATPEAGRAALREQIPVDYWTQLGLAPTAGTPQMSSSSP